MLVALGGIGARGADAGPFFEPEQPFFHSQVEVLPPAAGETLARNFVVRGILIPVGRAHCVLFDQELLRVAAIWEVPPGEPLVTLKTMPQISYADGRRKAGGEHPEPTGGLLLTTGMHPGVASDLAQLRSDPRAPSRYADAGRGPLPEAFARFEGLAVHGEVAVLHYRSGATAIREWHELDDVAERQILWRHLEIQPHAEPLEIAIGELSEGIEAVANSRAVVLRSHDGELVARVAPAEAVQRVSIGIVAAGAAAARETVTPAPPTQTQARRWPDTVTAAVQRDALQQNGLVLDRIATPDANPWHRRVRAADIAFLTDDRAAVVTYDGDVWRVDGLGNEEGVSLMWSRFASGLHEPLAIVTGPGGVVQVATKNGVVRVHDRDGNGEADWFENFCDGMIQSQTTRSFPLDMALGPDGATYVSQGGIVTRSGMQAGGEGTAHTGAIVRISPDGRTVETFGAAMREPFLAVHPETGVVTATDQQGHFIPSSVVYFVRAGDSFGFPERQPSRLTPPLVWLPHDQDISSSSQTWLVGERLGPWRGKLLHLSYGTGRMFIVSPDLQAPTPQGAVIPLDLKTDLPLLHGRVNPRGDAVLLCGFQIWGTRTTTNWSLGRLRPGVTPVVTPLDARSVGAGVVLTFATPVDAASLRPERVSVRAWNYRRSAAYGSGRYALDGAAGTTPLGVAQVVPSEDRRSVFVHLPKLDRAAQLEVRHDFVLANGALARGVVYFTVHEPAPVNLATLGFRGVDLGREATTIAVEKEPPATPALGRAIAESLGCLACHSTDGTTEGKTGPTWKELFGSTRRFMDGTSEVADELYLREKILDPQAKPMKAPPIEMPSYRGVVTEQQLEAIVMYIRSIGRRLD